MPKHLLCRIAEEKTPKRPFISLSVKRGNSKQLQKDKDVLQDKVKELEKDNEELKRDNENFTKEMRDMKQQLEKFDESSSSSSSSDDEDEQGTQQLPFRNILFVILRDENVLVYYNHNLSQCVLGK